MTKLAPVIIPTLCRQDHLQTCIDSLRQCPEACETELYIALDYPAKESHVPGWEQIQKYIPAISGFKDVKIIKREENLGADKNCRVLVKEVEQEHDAYIFSEDDNFFSRAFLSYMNWGLNKFRDDPTVSAICGYNYCDPNDEMRKYDYFRSDRFSAWGFGTWKTRSAWDNMSQEALDKLYNNWGNAFRLMGLDMSLFRKLRNSERYGGLMGDAQEECYLLLHPEVRIIKPVLSLVRNLGFDGTGEHCGAKAYIMECESHRAIDPRDSFTGEKEMTAPELLKITGKPRYNFLHKHPDLVFKYVFFQILKKIKGLFGKRS